MQTSMQTADMEISGLGSGSASAGVCSALKCIRGVAQVSMVPGARNVTVTYDASRVSPRQFETAVRVMGCEVERLVVRTADAPSVDKVPDAEASKGPVSRPWFRQA
jgi:allophanate hydrolase subunit 1